MNVLNRAYGQPLVIEEHSSLLLAGGINSQGYQCGMVWGSALAAGAHSYQLYGSGVRAEIAAVVASQKIIESFRARHHDKIDCFDISQLNMKSGIDNKQIVKFFLRGGPLVCMRMAARYAPIAYDSIESGLAEPEMYGVSLPVSCASMVARKLGATEQQVVMAAGLAGGIGLCGGGCGALGAAVWIKGMVGLSDKVSPDYKDPKVSEFINRFLKTSDYKFECSEIVGRKFESVKDHSEYLQSGGCAGLMEVLTSK